MEIIGLGTEIVECVRIREMIDRHGEHFLRRVFTDREIRDCQGRRLATEHFSGRWAAKEAVRKCLVLPGRANFPWPEVEIQSSTVGQPIAHLNGATRERADELVVGTFLISLSHTRNYASATAIAIRKG